MLPADAVRLSWSSVLSTIDEDDLSVFTVQCDEYCSNMVSIVVDIYSEFSAKHFGNLLD